MSQDCPFFSLKITWPFFRRQVGSAMEEEVIDGTAYVLEVELERVLSLCRYQFHP